MLAARRLRRAGGPDRACSPTRTTASAVVCTHRETLQLLFEHLAGAYQVVAEAGEPMEKGAVWILRGAVGGPQAPRLEYLGSAAALVV